MSADAIQAVEAEIEEYLSSRQDSTLVLGLSLRGERYVRGFRSSNAPNAPLPDADSVYEIGSVSKVYSTIILAELIGRGLIGLDDPIRKHLPSHLELRPEIGSITIRQLATHSAGFGSVGNLHADLIAEETRGTEPPFGAYTHYLRYKKEHLYSDLETVELDYPTGQGWLYSVLGMGTLGHILELVTGRPYEELLVEMICEPLGLPDTRYTLSKDQLARFVHAYDTTGQPLPNWYHDVMMPQGGLRSTVTDLLTFVEANIKASVDPDDSPLGTAMRLTAQQHLDWPAGYTLPGESDPPIFVQGLGWRGRERSDGWAWWHGGTTLFYLAGAGYDAGAQVGIALVSSYRRSLEDREVLHPLQQEWFQRICEGVKVGS